jgi:hypothetical protein
VTETEAWKRPNGCDCDASRPQTQRCTSAGVREESAWIRCNGRLAFVHKTRSQRARERRYG